MLCQEHRDALRIWNQKDLFLNLRSITHSQYHCLRLNYPEAEPEIRIWVQVDYLGGDGNTGYGGQKQSRKGNRAIV